MIIAGIDEAGRGCVLGPMVIAGVSIKKEKLKALKEIGVRDSKLLTKKRREDLFNEVLNYCNEIKVMKISAEEINNAMKEGTSLNDLEMKYFAKIIKMMSGVSTVYIDCPSTNEEGFGNSLAKLVKNKKIKIISENKADLKYPVVSCASIIAKVIRDHEIEKIKKKVKYDFGSGYPSDKRTVDFLRRMLFAPEVQKYVRKEWKTLQRVKQHSIFEYLELSGQNEKAEKTDKTDKAGKVDRAQQ